MPKEKTKVGKLIARIWDGISSIWKKAGSEVQRLAPIAIEAVERAKILIDSPVPDLITAMIPGELDDKAKEWLRKILPIAIVKLQLALAISGITDPNEMLRAILAKLKFASDAQRDQFYHEFGYLILGLLSDGNLSQSDAIQIAEYYYKHIHKPAA
jgi:hypothetical protein